MKKLPFFPLLFAVFPILSLGAMNIQEIDTRVLLRPALVSLISVAVLFFLCWLLLKDICRAAILTSFISIAIFSYGHLYHTLREIPGVGLSIARHRYLVVPYLAGLVLGIWWITRKLNEPRQFVPVLNFISIALLIVPVFQITRFSLGASRTEEASDEIFKDYEPLEVSAGERLPDVYYIILDTYMRKDALQEDYAFDNSAFIDDLGGRGFYVASCSRSNHPSTRESLVSSLNMDYFQSLDSRVKASGVEIANLGLLVQRNLVRRYFEDLGYTTIAFDTGYEWSRWRDADVYLEFHSDPLQFQMIEPFEAMVVQSTLGLLFLDWQIIQYFEVKDAIVDTVNAVNFPFQSFAARQLFTIDQLGNIKSIPGPKLVFAHILIPHPPRVFTPEGEIQADPGYYGGKLGNPINAEYNRLGYTSEIQFLNRVMIEIADGILASSPSAIIIIQGDTGVSGDNKYEILNAIHAPSTVAQRLYPSITPVNTFRLILTEFFGADLELLPDISYSPEGQVVPETSPACVR
jgi:hypothetical protein